MTTARAAASRVEHALQPAIAAQFRSLLARMDISARELARRMGVGHTWVTDRRKGDVTITIEDTIRMAPHLGMRAEEIFAALYPPIADTPSGQVGFVVDSSTNVQRIRHSIEGSSQVIDLMPRLNERMQRSRAHGGCSGGANHATTA